MNHFSRSDPNAPIHARRGAVWACTLAVAALAACAATAGAQWSAPQTLSRAHTFVSPRLAVSAGAGTAPSGLTVASWLWQDGLGNDAAGGVSMAVRRAGVTFGAPRELPADVVFGPVAYGSRRVLIARQTDRPARKLDTLRVQPGDTRGRFAAPQTIARRAGITHVRLAANARGDAALAWFEDRPATRDRLYVSLRDGGSKDFSRPVALARDAIRAVSVAVGPAGHVLVAWEARGRIHTRYQPPSILGFRPALRRQRTQTLRSQDAAHAELRTAVAANGRAWVAWTAKRLSEGGDQGQVFVQAALRPAGARRFGRALLLQRAPSRATASPVSLALDGRGDATLAWGLWDGGPQYQTPTTTIRAARLTPTRTAVSEIARFAEIEPGQPASAAVDRAGNALVAWPRVIDSLRNHTLLYASLGPRTGGWGAPELVSPGLQAMAPIAGYPPAGGPPFILYANRPTARLNGTYLQAATRTG